MLKMFEMMASLTLNTKWRRACSDSLCLLQAGEDINNNNSSLRDGQTCVCVVLSADGCEIRR